MHNGIYQRLSDASKKSLGGLEKLDVDVIVGTEPERILSCTFSPGGLCAVSWWSSPVLFGRVLRRKHILITSSKIWCLPPCAHGLTIPIFTPQTHPAASMCRNQVRVLFSIFPSQRYMKAGWMVLSMLGEPVLRSWDPWGTKIEQC